MTRHYFTPADDLREHFLIKHFRDFQAAFRSFMASQTRLFPLKHKKCLKTIFYLLQNEGKLFSFFFATLSKKMQAKHPNIFLSQEAYATVVGFKKLMKKLNFAVCDVPWQQVTVSLTMPCRVRDREE